MPNVRQTILETLSQHGPLGMEEIARATHLSKMAARYHMGLLERAGLVSLFELEHRRSVGRPKIRYALSEQAHDVLPKQYEAFAALLVSEVTRTLGSRQARGLLRRMGRRIAATAPPLYRHAGTAVRLKRLVKFLSPRGYRASWEKRGDGYELVMHDCPYRQVAQAQPGVCELDRAIIGALLGTPFAMTACISTRDPECHFVIENQSER